MEGNPYFYGLSSHENVEIKLYNKANPLKPWKMMGRMHDKYLIADGKTCLLYTSKLISNTSKKEVPL